MKTDNNCLYDEIERLSAPQEQVSSDEYGRIADLVAAQITTESVEEKTRPVHRYKKSCHPVIKTISTIAACLLLLMGLNIANPVFAEGIPFIGSIFSYFNNQSKVTLKSDRIQNFAEEISSEATVSAEETDVFKNKDLTLTVDDAYADGIYLRFTSTIKIGDDSLSQYDWIGMAPWEKFCGTIKVNGEELDPYSSTVWEKADDRTFVAETICNLRDTQNSPQPMDVEFSVGDLEAQAIGTPTSAEDELISEIIHKGDITAHFSVTPDVSGNRTGTLSEAQNGIELISVLSTPGETRVTLSIPKKYNSPAMTLHTSDGQALLPASGSMKENGDTFIEYSDFDAAPQDCSELIIRVIDKNVDDAVLAEFITELN